MRKLLPLILMAACTTNNISQPSVAAMPTIDASVQSMQDGGSAVTQTHDAAQSVSQDAGSGVDTDAAVAETDSSVATDASEPVIDAGTDSSVPPNPADFVGSWTCTYTQTTDISGKTLNPPQGGVAMLDITSPTPGVYVVEDALGLSGNLPGSLQGATLTAQNAQSAYSFSLNGTTLEGSWTNLTYPKMLTSLSCTK